MTVLAQDLKPGPPDAYPNVYTIERFLTNGKNYEVLYYTPDNDKIGSTPAPKRAPGDTAAADSVPWKRLTPLVFFENKLVAKGWASWDSISTVLNVALKKHDQ